MYCLVSPDFPTWSMLSLYSGIRVTFLFLFFVFLYVLCWLSHVFCCVCLYSPSCLFPGSHSFDFRKNASSLDYSFFYNWKDSLSLLSIASLKYQEHKFWSHTFFLMITNNFQIRQTFSSIVCRRVGFGVSFSKSNRLWLLFLIKKKDYDLKVW